MRVGDVTREAPWAPTIVANLTLPLLGGRRVRNQESWHADAASPPACLAQADARPRRWAAHGFAEVERRELDGWAALVLERA